MSGKTRGMGHGDMAGSPRVKSAAASRGCRPYALGADRGHPQKLLRFEGSWLTNLQHCQYGVPEGLNVFVGINSAGEASSAQAAPICAHKICSTRRAGDSLEVGRRSLQLKVLNRCILERCLQTWCSQLVP